MKAEQRRRKKRLTKETRRQHRKKAEQRRREKSQVKPEETMEESRGNNGRKPRKEAETRARQKKTGDSKEQEFPSFSEICWLKKELKSENNVTRLNNEAKKNRKELQFIFDLTQKRTGKSYSSFPISRILWKIEDWKVKTMSRYWGKKKQEIITVHFRSNEFCGEWETMKNNLTYLIKLNHPKTDVLHSGSCSKITFSIIWTCVC